jgi:hypothetical protein
MTILRWTITALLLLLFGAVAAGNIVGAMLAIKHRRNYSMVPVIGGIAGAIGLYLAPINITKWWVPLLCDPSTLCLLWIMPAAIFTGFRTGVWRI